ncbi:MAG: hypothetical protein AB7N65_04970 [Vicinamibacterales bacterium]
MAQIAEAVRRLKGIVVERAGERLSYTELTRACGLDRDRCDALIEAFEDARFLRRSPTGYVILDRAAPVTPGQLDRPGAHESG